MVDIMKGCPFPSDAVSAPPAMLVPRLDQGGGGGGGEGGEGGQYLDEDEEGERGHHGLPYQYPTSSNRGGPQPPHRPSDNPTYSYGGSHSDRHAHSPPDGMGGVRPGEGYLSGGGMGGDGGSMGLDGGLTPPSSSASTGGIDERDDLSLISGVLSDGGGTNIPTSPGLSLPATPYGHGQRHVQSMSAVENNYLGVAQGQQQQ